MKKFKLIINDLKKLKKDDKSQVLAKFFKTGPGEYGEGDIFWGITVPEQRKIAKKYNNLSLAKIAKLLDNPIHEVRLTGALILVAQYEKTSEVRFRTKIYQFYLNKLEHFNNWDLIDLSVYKILGHYLFHYENNKKAISILEGLAQSSNLWRRRAAMVATFYFIKQGRHQETFKIADILISDNHDLIHKAMGWMLREVGKKVGENKLRYYLDKNYYKIPRTTLRYALEKLKKEKRDFYLNISK